MGERKLKDFLTFKELREQYGFSQGFFYKHSKAFDAALLKINGKPIKPYRFDPDIISQIICTGQPSTKKGTASSLKTKRRGSQARKQNLPDNVEVDDLWL